MICRVFFLLVLAVAVPLPAQLTRVANTTLTLPQNPQTFGYRTEDAFPGISFDQPVGLANPPGENNRVFVVEKTGRIQVVSNLSSTPTKSVFLDLTSRVLVSDTTEEGLLGLAFHPNFAVNRYIYVFYTISATTTAGSGRHDRLSRFTVLPGATNADILATEVPLISQRDEANNHNGGDLHFGPDGYLYVSLGDEGGGDDSFGNSQRIDRDFFSGLLRIDVDRRAGNLAPAPHAAVHAGTYLVPADNPFVGATTFNGLAVSASAVRTEFWAVGLRNPWRFSIDAPTGRILVGDVGQSAREEIDLITRGGNYGWNYREGTIAGPRSGPPAGAAFVDPIWEADRGTASSITGGVVYRGSRWAQLFGRYVFGDYPSGRVFVMTFPATGPVQVQQVLVENSPVGFGTDPVNGDILIASVGAGAVRRLVYNSTPTGTPLPATLTATGAFSSLATLTPAAGVVSYEPNVSFWSDYANKRRWFSLPALAGKITFAAEGNWSFPAGTVWIKHFDLELTRGDPSTARRLETRFVVKTAAGVYGVTYRWNPAQTEATLVPEEGADETIQVNEAGVIRAQVWRYPSRAECLQCHTSAGGYALGFNTAQLNRAHNYPAGTANQLTALAAAGYFTVVSVPSGLRALAAATDASATLEHRFRSYLAANCVQCHQPGGSALGNWDARIETPTAGAGLVNGPLVNSAGSPANRVVVPGDTAHSMLLTRLSTRGSGQMPPLASNELDPGAMALVSAWIASLVGVPPSISSQPAGQSVAAGNPVTFDVVAGGSPPPSFQWRKNGVNIAGATGSSYSIASVAPGDAGTYTVVVTNSSGSVTSNGAALEVRAGVSSDFNADGHPDILLENLMTGQRVLWLMSGPNVTLGVDLGGLPAFWHIAGAADFSGDGKPDIMLENLASGQRVLWVMNGPQFAASVDLGFLDPAWRMVLLADFTADGQVDIVLENEMTGQRTLWIMDGFHVALGVDLGVLDPVWHFAGTADFNHDGDSDILLENASSGQRVLWMMDGLYVTVGVDMGVLDPAWHFSAVADFDGDGKPDVLLENVLSGQRVLWLMNGVYVTVGIDLGVLDTAWHIVD